MKWTREWSIVVPWGNLTLVSRGHPDGYPVFLVHGRQDSLAIFEPLIEQMSDQYLYVALDMPGNGLSDAFPHGPKLQRFHFLYAMELALQHLGWDRFIFMGHSMGCEQGLFYNVIYPNNITQMILLDAEPTLARMQIEDNAEYQKLFFDPYYDNYERDNFNRKLHTKHTASQSLQKLRDLSDGQTEHLLSRNFLALEAGTSDEQQKVIASESSNEEPPNPNQRAGTSDEQQKVIASQSSNEEPPNPNQRELQCLNKEPPKPNQRPTVTVDIFPNAATVTLPKTEALKLKRLEINFTTMTRSAPLTYNAPLNYNTPHTYNYPQTYNAPLNYNAPHTSNYPQTYNAPRIQNAPPPQNARYNQNDPWTERAPGTHSASEALNAHQYGNACICVENIRQEREELSYTDYEIDEDKHDLEQNANRRHTGDQVDDRLCGLIQRRDDEHRVGYLSWDNRLKNLAPQNYGNDYYFELFKTIPPTLLIAASDGMKNSPPNPKWRQGAKELLNRMATLDNFHRVDVEGSHDVHYTHPERVLPYINAFLKDKKVSSKL